MRSATRARWMSSSRAIASFTGSGNGQIVEAYNEWDFLTLCEQRGVIEKGGLARALDPTL